MAIIALRAWYLQEYEPIQELEKRPHDLRLSKNSLLKSGLRADFLEDSQDVKNFPWFKRYLEGETVEFYIEGSGSYVISNIDLISHEIYFTKQDGLAQLEPVIFFSYQTEYSASSQALREALSASLDKLNERSRLPLTLIESQRSSNGPVRLSSTQIRKIRKSLLFIADTTAITSIKGEEHSQLIASPNVCIEMGYALQSKKTEQILLAQMQRKELVGQFSFELPPRQQLLFETTDELNGILLPIMENLLQRFNLFT